MSTVDNAQNLEATFKKIRELVERELSDKYVLYIHGISTTPESTNFSSLSSMVHSLKESDGDEIETYIQMLTHSLLDDSFINEVVIPLYKSHCEHDCKSDGLVVIPKSPFNTIN